MGSNSSLAELLHNLDATTYFFVTSGLFIGLVALVFFILGLWSGGLLWRGYKRRWRHAEATIESLKHEAAQLKRRIAGQSPRAQGNTAASGVPEPEFVSLQEQACEQEALKETSIPMPAGRPFTLWTESPAVKAVRIAEVLSNTHAEAPAAEESGFTAPLLFPTQPEPQAEAIHFPPSQAFSLWTEEGWEPPSPAPAPRHSPPSAAFTLWTMEDFRPAQVRLTLPPSAAFTLWTHPDFAPAPPSVFPSPAPEAIPALPISREALVAATATAVRSVASHPRQPQHRVIEPFPDERHVASPRSRAFTLWTQPSDNLTPRGSGISQRSALASLIRSRVDASPLPPLDMEPLPFVPVPDQGARGA